MSLAAILLILFLIGAFIPAFAVNGNDSSAEAAVQPANITAILKAGESVAENKTVTITKLPLVPLDVFFEFDLTSSMGGVLVTAKNKSIEIMNNISSITGNASFGVGSFMDYNGAFDSCGYAAFYGSGADYPWSLDQNITPDKNATSSAINLLLLGSGNDGPESYARALYESQFLAWRNGSKRIVVIFEDNIPHDCSIGTYGCGEATTGTDPGRDALTGTADDLPWADVIAQLKAAGIEVIVVDTSGGFSCDGPWLYAVNQTNGLFVQLDNVSDIPEKIVASIQNLTARLNNLTLMPQAGFENWTNWTPESYSDVGINNTVNFAINITVPNGTAPGNYTFVIKIIGDDIILALQNVSITVIEAIDTSPPVINKTIHGPKSGSCPPAGNQTCYIQDHVTSIIVNASDLPAGGVQCNWSVTGPDAKNGSGVPPFNITINKDSTHILAVICKDAANNTAADNETFLVDSIPPSTNITFKGAKITQSGSVWLNNQTNITFAAADNKVGVGNIYYRIALVNDTYCDKRNRRLRGIGDSLKCKDAPSPGSFFDVFTEPVRIQQQSCHLIEFYSVDKLGNNESSPLNQLTGQAEIIKPKRQCVFIDNVSPIPNKTVGEPKKSCTINTSLDCWAVTKHTPVTLSCIDQKPHPVAAESICFRVQLSSLSSGAGGAGGVGGSSGIDLTKKYCRFFAGEVGADGFCCVKRNSLIFKKASIKLKFKELSWHNLQFYCKDALQNKGAVDEEIFDVRKKLP